MTFHSISAILVFSLLAGCARSGTRHTLGDVAPIDVPNAFRPQIVYPGTADFDRRIESFSLTPDQARDIANMPFGAFGPACDGK